MYIDSFFLNELKNYLENDKDFVNVFKTSRLTYSFKKNFRFKNFPIKYYCKVLGEGSTEKIGYIPKKFKIINIQSPEQNNKIGNHRFFDQFQILHIRYGFFASAYDSLAAMRSPNVKSLKLLSLGDIRTMGSIPQCLLSFELNYNCKSVLEKNVLPESLTKLSLSMVHIIDQPVDFLPLSLVELHLLNKCNIKSSLSHLKSLKILTLGGNFNLPLEGFLPDSLEELTLSDSFFQTIRANTLPESLTTLKFGKSFSCGFEKGSLRRLVNLKSLTFGNEFNTVIAGDEIPENLEYLKMGTDFNQDIPLNFLNNNKLKTLIFGYSFSRQILPFTLPDSLENLVLGSKYNTPFIYNILGKNLKSLELGLYYNQEIEAGTLPESLTTLKICPFFQKSFKPGVLPSGLRNLIYSSPRYCKTPQFQKGVLPSQLRVLVLSSFSNPLEPDILPPLLEELDLGDNFNYPLIPLPKNLVKLRLGKKFKLPIPPGLLPQSIRDLDICGLEEFPLTEEILPNSLFHLNISTFSLYPEYLYLPQTLCSIVVSSRYFDKYSSVFKNIPRVFH